VTTVTHITGNQDTGTLTAATEQFTLKSEVGADGQEKDIIKGMVATTHTDSQNDRFTEQALQEMAEDIKTGDKNIKAVFNDVNEEVLQESQIGNLDHNSNPAAPFADTRTIPIFKTVDAEVRSLQDGEKGLHVKGEINSDGALPETVSAVKNSIRDGFLSGFSVEFVAKKARRTLEDNRVIRIIESAEAKGAALTARPVNKMAQMTDAMLKSAAVEYKADYMFETGDNVSWNDTSGTVRDRTKDSCFNEEIDGDFEVCGSEDDPAYLIEVDNDEGTMVGHKQSLFTEGKSNYEEKSENNTTTMTDNEQPEEKPEAEPEESEKAEGKSESVQEEGGSLKDEVAEIKSSMKALKDTNESLKEENEELKSELEDLKTVQEIKSELNEVKSIFENVELEDGARVPEQESKSRDVSDGDDQKVEWKSKLDDMPDGYMQREGKSESRINAFAQNHGITEKEVKSYVNTD